MEFSNITTAFEMMKKDTIQQIKQRFSIVGNNDALMRAIEVAMQVAPIDLSVLITGESGVGKEIFPQIIHQNSKRKHSQYIAVNCGAIPEGTIDSELFGHEKGAFTGAIGERKGYFGEADGGTIFLDEVGELPLQTQARLLRVLETGEFIKVGSSKVQKTNVRIVAATNVNLPQAIAEGKFREDLYYRLNTVPIYVPPLRERGNDIVLLFRKFAMDFAERYHMPSIQLTDEAKHLLLQYSWPGNVRQLKNIAEQISVIETNRDIDYNTLLNYIPQQEKENMPALTTSLDKQQFEAEKEVFYKLLLDMKKELDELKIVVHRLMNGETKNMDLLSNVSSHIVTVPQEPVKTIIHTPEHTSKDDKDYEIQDTEEYVEETLSLDDVEREIIKKALAKHNNKRKDAARELNISERTLYRKIKEYGFE